MELTETALDRVVRDALAEDVGDAGDRTSEGLFDRGLRCRARLLVKEPGVVCGLDAFVAVYAALDPDVRVTALVADGAEVTQPPVAVAAIDGPARAVLTGERTALNLLARLSGIATLDAPLRRGRRGHRRDDPRHAQDDPGLRALEKYAVRCGGGDEPSPRPARRDPHQGQPPAPRAAASATPSSGCAPPARPADRGRVRHARRGRRGARRRRRPDPARQHAAAAPAGGRRPGRRARAARGLGRRHPRQRAHGCARPASTSSPSAR